MCKGVLNGKLDEREEWRVYRVGGRFSEGRDGMRSGEGGECELLRQEFASGILIGEEGRDMIFFRMAVYNGRLGCPSGNPSSLCLRGREDGDDARIVGAGLGTVGTVIGAAGELNLVRDCFLPS